MTIKNSIKLGNINYYISYDCNYQIKDGMTRLCLKNTPNYYDGGDLSRLIKKIESNYDKLTYQKYDKQSWFLSDCLYIYDNIPFISGIGDFYLDKDDVISSMSYITKEELDKYIKENNIQMNDNSNFKLYDERTWS